MEEAIDTTYSKREKMIAACILFTNTFLSALTLILIIAILKYLIEAKNAAGAITKKYGWIFGMDEGGTRENLSM